MAYIAAIDQGTTGTRCLILTPESEIIGSAYQTHKQYYPKPGWVEHDPNELYENTISVVKTAIETADISPDTISAIGIANQRETTIVWDQMTGKPVYNAIVWQDRRTTDRIEEIHEINLTQYIIRQTGLEPDAYFSATKLEWILDNVSPPEYSTDLRTLAHSGRLCFGTVDTWLIWNLTGSHITDVTNASRTMLFDIHEISWDQRLLDEFNIPPEILPTVRPSSDPNLYGFTGEDLLGYSIPVSGALGDQQAALFGQTCFEPGSAKNTYGTGAFMLQNVGTEPVYSDHGLLTTIAYQLDGAVHYALEGSIFSTGAAIEWLIDIGLLENPEESEAIAKSVTSTGDVYFVPAFSGLGAPYWNQRARGTIIGLTQGTTNAHIVRATLEAIAYQTKDVALAMSNDSGLKLSGLRIDGGASQNDFLCQIQADVLNIPVSRPQINETTALGAAYAAGLAVGLWDTREELKHHLEIDAEFNPELSYTEEYSRWKEAIGRSTNWAQMD